MSEAALNSPVCLFIARDDAVDRRARDGPRSASADHIQAGRRRRAHRGETLLRIALARATGTLPAEWRTGRTTAGRPVVAGGPQTAAHMQISLAHSGPYLVASTSACGAVAVDLEVMRERRYAEIARYLGWPVHTWANGLAADAFFHLWTLWESAIKLTSARAGIAAAELFASFEHEIDAGRPAQVRVGARTAGSWLCADRFWMTMLAENTDNMRLFCLRSWPSDGLRAGIDELDAQCGALASLVCP